MNLRADIYHDGKPVGHAYCTTVTDAWFTTLYSDDESDAAGACTCGAPPVWVGF